MRLYLLVISSYTHRVSAKEEELNMDKILRHAKLDLGNPRDINHTETTTDNKGVLKVGKIVFPGEDYSNTK